MRRIILTAAAVLLLCSTASAQYPMYFSPWQAIQWQYQQAYGVNPAVMQRQAAFSRWQVQQARAAEYRAWQRDPWGVIQHHIDLEIDRRLELERQNRQMNSYWP